MKRGIVGVLVLVATAVGAALAYQTAARQRDYRTLLRRGDAALAEDQTFGAIEAYSGAIALRPDAMLAYLRRGETYQRRADRGDFDAAAKDFRAAASLDATATRPLEALGDVLYQLQRYDRAAEAFTSYLKLDDRSARVSHKLAVAQYRAGDLDAALTAVNEALRLDDRLADAHYLRGVCLREQWRLTEAVPALERAVTLSPGLIPAREELVDLYDGLGRDADEIEELQMLALLDRDHVER